jgi:amidohydrolase
MQPEGLIERLAAIRRELHGLAEPPGQEKHTAAYIVDLLKTCNPTHLLEGVGGHGLLAEFSGARPGPRVGLRAELDGLAEDQGARHGCGHDGHMALLCGVALSLVESPPQRGSVVLIFQPAEETGRGAAAMLAAPPWSENSPDLIFAMHNLPGLPLGQVALRSGFMNMASTGLEARITGAASHAAQPEQGSSPASALARLLGEMPALAEDSELLTLTHARLGKEGFGTSPGEALLQATLRAPSDAMLASLRERAEKLISSRAVDRGLECRIQWPEPFAATNNHPYATDLVLQAAKVVGLDSYEPEQPFRWSEDFGRFTQKTPGALFCLGAGEKQPPLHAAGYLFPDGLLQIGLRLWLSIIEQVLTNAR